MTIQQYIDRHYQEIKSKVKLVMKNHECYEDLLNDMIIILLEKSPDMHHQLLRDDKVQHWIVKSCKLQFNSGTSPFHTQYRKHRGKSLDGIEIEDIIEQTEDIDGLVNDVKLYIGKLPHYHRTIAEQHFYDNKSQRELSRYYNINRIHIKKDISTIQSGIKQTFNREDYKNK